MIILLLCAEGIAATLHTVYMKCYTYGREHYFIYNFREHIAQYSFL